jgi:hypothetical protein
MPYRPRFLFACINREIRYEYMQRLLYDITWYWPNDYYPTREDYRAVGCVLFVLMWQSWAGILLTIVSAIIYKHTKE